jgi:hypothetical protein
MSDEFKTMKELTDRVFKSAEDEEFERIEREQSLGLHKRPQSAEEAFMAWVEHSHHPQHFHIERNAFIAGWDAAMKKRWREQND